MIPQSRNTFRKTQHCIGNVVKFLLQFFWTFWFYFTLRCPFWVPTVFIDPWVCLKHFWFFFQVNYGDQLVYFFACKDGMKWRRFYGTLRNSRARFGWVGWGLQDGGGLIEELWGYCCSFRGLRVDVSFQSLGLGWSRCVMRRS